MVNDTFYLRIAGERFRDLKVVLLRCVLRFGLGYLSCLAAAARRGDELKPNTTHASGPLFVGKPTNQ